MRLKSAVEGTEEEASSPPLPTTRSHFASQGWSGVAFIFVSEPAELLECAQHTSYLLLVSEYAAGCKSVRLLCWG